MNDIKLSPADLAAALARRGSLPRRYCEDFVRSFFEVIEEGLVHDNLVKIKGFGTFKVVDIDARESVNVSTGERFEIASHTKVSFTPDATLRDAVNKPFLAFQTVVINDDTDVKKMEAIEEPAAEEPVVEAPVVEGPVVETPAVAEPVVEEPAVAEPVVEEPVAEEPAVEEPVVEEPVAEAPVVEAPAVAEPVAAAAASVVEKPAAPTAATPAAAPAAAEPAAEQPSCSCHGRCHAIWGVILALVFLALGYCIAYYWHPVALPELRCEQEEAKVEAVDAQKEAAKEAAAAPAKRKPSGQPAETASYPQLEGGDYWIVGELGTEKMTAGKTLLNMALKYYKNKDLFIYICTMNEITNPDIVPLDKELRIPELKDKKTGKTPQEVAEAEKNQN